MNRPHGAILIADDSAMNISVAKSLFEKLNLSESCHYFEDGQKVINHVKQMLEDS